MITKKSKNKKVKTSFELNLERELREVKDQLAGADEQLKKNSEWIKYQAHRHDEEIYQKEKQITCLRLDIRNLQRVIITLGQELLTIREQDLSNYQSYAAVPYSDQKEECNTIHPKVPVGKTINKRRK